ncbi:hemerythrin domain-containing protein [Psychromonas arctica]|uniref:hemerythrin domain-containing protein n=1 Tax=Psychromonas arctica TaxID=168275 RepID=UPI002FD3C674
MINRIHKDHINIMQLLKVIENKIAMLKIDGSIDYQLLKSITDYLKSYADKYHHPMEDLIYAYYLKYRVVSDQVANRLEEDHQQLSDLTTELDDMLNMILLDAIIPKDIFIEKLETFVNKQKQHLSYEELSILPAIQASLTEDDWAHLSLQWKHKEYVDPLFGDSISDRFKNLSEHIYSNTVN